MEIYTKHIIVFSQIGVGILLFGCYATTIVFLVAKFEAELKQTIYQSTKNNSKLKEEYIQKLIYFQEEDRKRLSEELHDNVMSRFQLMRLNLYDGNIELLQKNLQNSMKIIRELSHNFAPLAENEQELSLLIEDYIVQIKNQIHVTFSSHSHLKEKELPMYVKLMVFRIFQELISNILKHAEATEIEVRLRNTAQFTILYVKDNGRGFDLEKASKGIGLKNIQYRAANIKSTYKFKTEIEKYTMFIMCIPKPNPKSYE